MTAMPDPSSQAPGLHDQSEACFRQLFAQSPIASLLVNRDGLVVDFNTSAADLLMIDPAMRSKPDLPGYVTKEQQSDLMDALQVVHQGEPSQTVDLTLNLASGQSLPLRLVIMPVPDDKSLLMVTLFDLQGHARSNKVLSQLAYYDQLTGLPNRLLFNDRLRWAIRDARRRDELMAVMMIDLDHFKNVNDTLGHEAGDELLKIVSGKMLASLRDSDTLSRLSGDEFALLMQHVSDSTAAKTAAERLLETIAESCEIDGRQVRVSGSIGICMYPEDAETADTLLHNADIAMYMAKTAGRNQSAFFNESMREQAARQSEMEDGLRRALEQNNLELFYQPVVDSDRCRIISVEALLRWKPDGGDVVPAGDFFSVAERIGLCSEFSDWALRNACLQMKIWLDQGLLERFEDLTVSVNLSYSQLIDKDLVKSVRRALSLSSLPASYLAVEVTESSLKDENPQIANNLRALRDLGVSLNLDDFSEGFSSLQKISGIPFKILKIDQIMTKVFFNNPSGEALLEALLNLAHILGLEVVAEGIESQETYSWFREHQCDGVQGFYFCRPLPAMEMEMLLELPQLS